MRKLSIQKRNKPQPRRPRKHLEHRSRPHANQRLLPQWEDAGKGLEYLQVGRFFGIWRVASRKGRN